MLVGGKFYMNFLSINLSIMCDMFFKDKIINKYDKNIIKNTHTKKKGY